MTHRYPHNVAKSRQKRVLTILDKIEAIGVELARIHADVEKQLESFECERVDMPMHDYQLTKEHDAKSQRT